jgi:hypothetical protein
LGTLGKVASMPVLKILAKVRGKKYNGPTLDTIADEQIAGAQSGYKLTAGDLDEIYKDTQVQYGTFMAAVTELDEARKTLKNMEPQENHSAQLVKVKAAARRVSVTARAYLLECELLGVHSESAKLVKAVEDDADGVMFALESVALPGGGGESKAGRAILKEGAQALEELGLNATKEGVKDVGKAALNDLARGGKEALKDTATADREVVEDVGKAGAKDLGKEAAADTAAAGKQAVKDTVEGAGHEGAAAEGEAAGEQGAKNAAREAPHGKGDVVAEHSANGHEYKVYEDGSVIRCSANCAPVRSRLDALKEFGPPQQSKGAAALRRELANAEKILDVKAKAAKMAEIDAKFSKDFGPGEWASEFEELHGSDASAEYQAKVTGASKGACYRLNNVAFDGFEGGKLIDAKHYADPGRFVSGASRSMKIADEYMVKLFGDGKKIEGDVIRQLRAAGNLKIEWRVPNQTAKDMLDAVFAARGVKIDVVVVPP